MTFIADGIAFPIHNKIYIEPKISKVYDFCHLIGNRNLPLDDLSPKQVSAEASCFFLLLLIVPVVLSSLRQALTYFGLSIIPRDFSLFPIAILLVILLLRFFWRTTLWRAGFYLALTALFLLASDLLLDLSWDGLAYHQRAIYSLYQGKNLLLESSGSIWSDYYPKATWYFASEVYLMLGDIQPGKAYHWLSSAFIFFYGLRFSDIVPAPKIYSILFSAGLALNTIFISQFDTFYLDSIFGALTFAIVFSTVLIFAWNRAYDWCVLLLASVLIINLKFSGFAPPFFACLILSSVFLWKKDARSARKTIFWGLSILGLSVLIVGFDPYMKNIARGHHPLHPLLGESSLDIMSLNYPDGFRDRNRLVNLGTSVFSASQNLMPSDGRPSLKIPGRMKKGEIPAFSTPDVRIGGWGPLFSLSLLLGFIAVFWFRPSSLLTIAFALILMITLVNPEAWWARYAPQILAMPGLAALNLLRSPGREKGRPFLSILILLLLLLNTAVVAPEKILKSIEETRIVSDELHGISGPHRVHQLNEFIAAPTLQRFGITPLLVPNEEIGPENDIKKVGRYFYVYQ